MKTALTVKCTAAEVKIGMTERSKAAALILKKIIRHLRNSVHRSLLGKSRDNRPEVMLMDEEEARAILNENLENERRERAVTQ